VANFTGLTANAYAGGDLTGYGPLIRARTALRNVNSDVTAYVLSPRDEGQLAGLVATDGQPINVPPAIAQVPMLTTNKIPTNLGVGTDESIILAGDWSRLMIGVRTAISITVLKERFADNMQYGFLAALRADVAAEQEAAFTKLTEVTLPP
jgi:HK97 family phage major capsid protein